MPEIPWKLECTVGVSGTPRVSRESWLEFREELRDTIKG